MTPPAVQRTAFEKDGGADARAIVNRESLYIEYEADRRSIHWSSLELSEITVEVVLIESVAHHVVEANHFVHDVGCDLAKFGDDDGSFQSSDDLISDIRRCLQVESVARIVVPKAQKRNRFKYI